MWYCFEVVYRDVTVIWGMVYKDIGDWGGIYRCEEHFNAVGQQ